MKPAFLIICLVGVLGTVQAQPVLKDIFGRNLSGHTITLVDWEGYLANPAIKLTITPPVSSLTVTLSANHSRLYFDMPSTAGATGPTKSITFTSTSPVDFYLSIFPDRGPGDEDYTLTLNSSYGTQTYAIHVIDQDAATPVIDYNVILDFSQDKPAYNFYASSTHRSIATQAANDWAFFLNNMHFDAVAAGTESTLIWDDDFASSYYVSNTSAYTGFLLYPYGIHTAAERSGGEPNNTNFQKIGGVSVNLRRSGGYESEAHGNYNTLGWDNTISDDTWYVATNLGSVQNDLYSIAQHEVGHAFCFNPGYPVFGTDKMAGSITDPIVTNYQLASVPISASDHLSGTAMVVDRISKKGAFGSDYATILPYGRWLITKLNLLILKSIGYDLKQTSAFKDVTISTTILPDGVLSVSYSSDVVAQWGIPFYNYTILSGSLPPGLAMDSFTGHISGVPSTAGTFNFTARVTDYDNKVFDKVLSIAIHTTAGVEEIKGQSSYSIYPNPFSKQTVLYTESLLTNAILSVYNQEGSKVKEIKNINGYNVILQRDDLASGLYFFRLTQHDQLIATHKILISDK